MPEKATEWFGMRVTPSQKEKIERLAEREGTTQKAAVLKAVERRLAEDESSALDQVTDLVDVEPEPGSVLDRTEDLCGSVEGPRDLSTSPKHREDHGTD
jgi:hypothetical protein